MRGAHVGGVRVRGAHVGGVDGVSVRVEHVGGVGPDLDHGSIVRLKRKIDCKQASSFC